MIVTEAGREKGRRPAEISRRSNVQKCMTLMVAASVVLSLDINHAITLIIEAHIRRGPDLLPHTAEMR